MTRLIATVICLAVLASLPGCVILTTWERATLNSRVMQDPMSPMEAALEGHVHSVRESAQGATSAAGSSCGCN